MLPFSIAATLTLFSVAAQALDQKAAATFEQNKQDADYRPIFTMSREHRKPRYLIFSCCDSRIDPQAIFGAKPGDIYSYRVPGNIVAVKDDGQTEAASISHILKSAIDDMQVESLAVVGHTECSAIEHLADSQKPVSTWAKVAGPVLDRVPARYPTLSAEKRGFAMVGENVRLQLERLLRIPKVKKALSAGKIKSVDGYVYELSADRQGTVSKWDEGAKKFVVVAGETSDLPQPNS